MILLFVEIGLQENFDRVMVLSFSSAQQIKINAC